MEKTYFYQHSDGNIAIPQFDIIIKRTIDLYKMKNFLFSSF